ncbi:AMP-dependent synthetase/ligase [Niabella aquatica]
MNISHTVLANASQYPDKPAVFFRKNNKWDHYTWASFRDKIFQTANALRKEGIRENDRVAIYSENSAEWVIMDLAALSVGAISVPVYATNTPAQALHILRDAAVKIVLAGNQLIYDSCIQIINEAPALQRIIMASPHIKSGDHRSVYFNNWIADQPQTFEMADRSEDDLLTLIYTSGTTGSPKGVMLSHGNFQAVIESHISFFNFTNPNQETSLAFLPLSHVFERAWTLLMLSLATTVYLLDNPQDIAPALREVKPTMMCAVPRLYQKVYNGVNDKIKKSSTLQQKIFHQALKVGTKYAAYLKAGKTAPALLRWQYQLAHHVVFKKIKDQMGGKLWFMPVGGAALSEPIERFFDALGIHLTLGYGLTETSATVCCHPLKNYTYGTVGIPMKGVKVKIGENNEILVKGKTVMKGYYGLPEETASVFTADGWLKTGDAGTIDAQGNIIIEDRIKDLMKTATGKYISPQQIEGQFAHNPYIDQIVVIADNKPFVSALVVPNFEQLKEWAISKGLELSDKKLFVTLPEVQKLYSDLITSVQKSMARFEQIKKIHLVYAEFTQYSGEITPTLKVKRKLVMERFENEIARMYL